MITRGADELIYPVPHCRLERVIEDPGVPVAPWRGVGPSQSGWVVESFVDELAHAAGKDPYAYRRELVAGQPRLLGVLDLAAQRAGWGSVPAAGRSRGIALWQFGETFLAQVAEVSVGSDGGVRGQDRKSTRLNSSHSQISYAVFCLKKKNNNAQTTTWHAT